MFLPPKTPIKTKYKCQKIEKVELDNSLKDVVKQSASNKRVIT